VHLLLLLLPQVSEVYVDTVGDPNYYQKKLTDLFTDVQPPIRVSMRSSSSRSSRT